MRPVRPEDANPLRAVFALLEPERLRARLAPGGGELGIDAAQRLTRLNPRTDFMLVACDPDPPGEAVIAALAHVRTDAAGHRGEFVVLVGDFIAQMGMGRYLLARVAKWARSRRLDVMEGELPADNPAMLELARSLGFRHAEPAADPALVRVSMELRTS